MTRKKTGKNLKKNKRKRIFILPAVVAVISIFMIIGIKCRGHISDTNAAGRKEKYILSQTAGQPETSLFVPESDGIFETDILPENDGMSETGTSPENDGMSETDILPENDGMSEHDTPPENDGMSETDLSPENDRMSETDIRQEEDDPNAWYHDIDVDMAGLKEQNPDIVGWIYFEDEDISYPLLYSGDHYYLRRNYRKEDETAGSIYIEGNNHSDLSDVHTLIYGHNMRNLSMFGKLKYYKTKDGYFDSHRYFQIITENAAYRYQVFAYKDVNKLTGGIYTIYRNVDENFKTFVEEEICQGSYVEANMEVDEDTHIVTLSTCSSDAARFTVSALRVDEHHWND